MKITTTLLTLSIAITANTVAAERATITNPDQLKPGQCAYAGEVYEPGEPIVGRVPGVAQVCANVEGHGVALTITKDSMDMLSKPSVTIRTEQVNGVSIQLADTNFSENGKRVACKQFIRHVEQDAKGQPTVISVDKDCVSM